MPPRLDELPLFVRDGAVLPYYAGPLRNSFMDLSAVELHLFCREKSARFEYVLDDRETRRYQAGAYGIAQISAEMTGERLKVEIAESGAYPPDTVTFTPVVYGRPELRELEWTVNGRPATRPLQTGRREWLCRPSEGTLDNPMLGNDSKPVKLVALGDFDRRAEYLEDCRGKGFADRLNRPGNPGGSNI
jgi:hypothetical protein